MRVLSKGMVLCHLKLKVPWKYKGALRESKKIHESECK